MGDRAAPENVLHDPMPTKATPSPTPPAEEKDPAAYGGLLFLGGLGSMLLGGVYTLFRTVKKRRRKA